MRFWFGVGIVVGIGQRHLDSQLLLPSGEIDVQFDSLLGIGIGEIFLFGGISGKIVEFNHAYTPSNRR